MIRLLQSIIADGEFTERGLARSSGVSQPHLHQILKRSKRLSPRVADLLLARLGLNVLHLFDSADLDRHVSELSGRSFAYVPVLEGRLGPGNPWPCVTHRFERFPAPCSMLQAGASHRVVRLAADPEIAACRNDGFALLSRGPGGLDLDPWHAICVDGQGLIRRVRKGRHDVFAAAGAGGSWKRIAALEDWPQVVRARVHLLSPAQDAWPADHDYSAPPLCATAE